MNHAFNTGELLLSRGINETININPDFNTFIYQSLGKHKNADWGDLCESDQDYNNYALRTGKDRLFSAYNYNETGERIWIITEKDRMHTTILYSREG